MAGKRRLAKLSDTASTAEDGRPKTGDEKEGELSSSEPPTRQSDQLYASYKTFECTIDRGCIPCAYKIGCFDVALDKEFCKATPNQRPEQCPRSSDNETDSNGVLGFRRGMSILTVGDGDFSFSLGLARRLLDRNQKINKEETFLVATSYESESTLRKVYPNFDKTLCELKELGVIVAYNVDATRILETLSLPAGNRNNNNNIKRRFHRICWNFPCTAIAKGQDGQNKAMEDNKSLVRNFVQSARSVLTHQGDGELYICHKTKPPFNQWNLEEEALSAQKRSQQQQRLQGDQENEDGSITPPLLLFYSGRIVLDRFLLPPYTPRKALDRKSFPCHDACFYIFAQEHPDKSAANRKRLFPSTIPSNNANLPPKIKESVEIQDGGEEIAAALAAEQNIGTDVRNNSTTLIKIQPELIQLIRRRHINTSAGKKRERNSKRNKRDF